MTAAQAPKPRRRKCEVCREWFMADPPEVKVCRVDCAMVLIRRHNAREYDLETQRRREELKPLGQLIKDAQRQFNRYIKARDFDQPCISCGKWYAEPVNGHYWDCGHFLDKESFPELRFNEAAAHREHSRCNRGAALRGGSARAQTSRYRDNLVTRIGEPLVIWIEGKHAAWDPTKDEMRALKAHYQVLANAAEKYAKQHGWLFDTLVTDSSL